MKTHSKQNKYKPRTGTQNNALHLWFDLVSKALNEGGYSVQLVLKETIDIDWDTVRVKELLWRPVQKVVLNKSSTTELRKIEDIDKVWEYLNRYLGERFGVHVPFPSNQEMGLIGKNYSL